jgi:hypothetical protein
MTPPDTVEMQAVKYAAMASRFTEEVLVEQYARFLRRAGGAIGHLDTQPQGRQRFGYGELPRAARSC